MSDATIINLQRELARSRPDLVVVDKAFVERSRARARLCLERYMSDVSEERWSAGWLIDLEHILWIEMHDEKATQLEPAHRRNLRELHEDAGGWFFFDRQKESWPGESFIETEAWKLMHAEWLGKRDG